MQVLIANHFVLLWWKQMGSGTTIESLPLGWQGMGQGDERKWTIDEASLTKLASHIRTKVLWLSWDNGDDSAVSVPSVAIQRYRHVIFSVDMIHLVGMEEEIVFFFIHKLFRILLFLSVLRFSKPSDLFLNTLFGYKSTYFYLITTLSYCLFTDN